MPQFMLAETRNCGARAGGLSFPTGALRGRHGAPGPARKTISRDWLWHPGGEWRAGTCGEVADGRVPAHHLYLPRALSRGPSDWVHVWGCTERALRQRVQKKRPRAGAIHGGGLGKLFANLPVLQGKCCHIGEIPNHLFSLGDFLHVLSEALPCCHRHTLACPTVPLGPSQAPIPFIPCREKQASVCPLWAKREVLPLCDPLPNKGRRPVSLASRGMLFITRLQSREIR